MRTCPLFSSTCFHSELFFQSEIFSFDQYWRVNSGVVMACQAWELGYNLIIVEDATSTFSAEMHDFAFSKIFPRISRVVKSADLAFS